MPFRSLCLRAGSTNNGGFDSEEKLAALKSKISKENLPLFEFGKELKTIIEASEAADETGSGLSLILMQECESLYNEYVSLLRDHYFEVFKKDAEAASQPSEAGLAKLKLHIAGECLTAMTAAKPNFQDCSHWSHEGPMVELIDDIDSMIMELDSSNFIEESSNPSANDEVFRSAADAP
jgi:hypothetical protein